MTIRSTVAALLVAWACALPARALEPLYGPRTERTVFLQPLLASDDADNDVDRWLVDIARSDGTPQVLDRRDFLRAVSDETVDSFLASAARYVNARWIQGDRSSFVVTQFLDEVGKLNLPPRYTVFLLYGSADIGRLRKGHLIGFMRLGTVWADSTIQGHPVHWSMFSRSLGAESLWPFLADPYQARWPLVYVGLGLDAAHATGSLTTGGVPAGDANMFALTTMLSAHLRYTLSPNWLLKGTIGTGFGIGTLKVDTSEDGDIQDPCKIDPSRGLDLNAAAAAVRCTATNTFGFFQSYPLRLDAGVELWGWLGADLVYQRASFITDKVQFAPQTLQDLSLRIGINFY